MLGKTAVCLYGLMRSNKLTAHSILEHLIKPLDADLFICCPDYFYPPIHLDSFIAKKTEDLEIVDEKYLSASYGDYLKSFRILPYEPEMFHKVIKDNDLPEENYIPQKIYRILSMFYHIKNVIELRKLYENSQNIMYDTIILTRPDLEISPNHKINIKDINIDLTKVWTTNHHISPVHGFAPFVFSDLFIFSNPKNINLLGDIYDNIVEYHKNNIVINQETLAAYQFIKNNISFSINNIVNHRIIR